jgi:NitT/TauT family transport system ATP-binding protein
MATINETDSLLVSGIRDGPRMEVRGLGKRFDNPITDESIEVLVDVNLAIGKGEFLTIVGPSGCGKTTLLRILAGLMPATDGQVLNNGRPVTGPLPTVGFVFQSDNLMPWRNVYDNIGFGPELRGERAKTYGPRIEYLLELVGLAGFGKYYPHQLSGGMRQRVNLARALAIEPDVLLMDEPFASLDAQTREIMQDELLRIWRNTGNTVVLVTHQIDEALFLADRLLILAARPGRVQEVIKVDIPRPRTLDVKRTARFTELADHVWQGIERQVRASIREEQIAGSNVRLKADIAKE